MLYSQSDILALWCYESFDLEGVLTALLTVAALHQWNIIDIGDDHVRMLIGMMSPDFILRI